MKEYDELFFGSFCEILLDCYEKFSGSSKDKRSGKIEFGRQLLLCGTSNSFKEDIEYASIDDCVSDKMMSGYLNNRPITATIISQYFNDGYEPRTALSEKAGRKYFKDEIVPYIIDKKDKLYEALADLIKNDSNIPEKQKKLFSQMPFTTEKEMSVFLYAVFFYSIRVTDAKAFEKKTENKETKNVNSSDASSLSKALPGAYNIYNAPFDDIPHRDMREPYGGIHERYVGDNIRIFYGVPGIGKSTEAFDFLKNQAIDRRRTAIWIDSANDAVILMSIRTFLIEKDIEPNASRKSIVSDEKAKRIFKKWLDSNDMWDIVFDDAMFADGKWTYEDYLPKEKEDCFALITTEQTPDTKYTSRQMEPVLRMYINDYYFALFGEPYSELHKSYERKYGWDDFSFRFNYMLEPDDTISDFSDTDRLLGFAGNPLAIRLACAYAQKEHDYDFQKARKMLLRDCDLFQRQIVDKSGKFDEVLSKRLFFDLQDIHPYLDLEINQWVAAYLALDERLRYYLEILVSLPNHEIYADTLYEILYNGDNFDIFSAVLDSETWFELTNPDRFAAIVKELEESGFCSVSHYTKGDSRYIKEFGGLKRIKLHRCLCLFFKSWFSRSDRRSFGSNPSEIWGEELGKEWEKVFEREKQDRQLASAKFLELANNRFA